MRRSVILMIVIGLALAGLVLFLALQFPDALTSRGEQIQLTQALLLVAVIGGAVLLVSGSVVWLATRAWRAG